MGLYCRLSSFIVTAFAAASLAISAHADSVLTQTFSDSWRVEVWDYYGNVSALKWQYTPYTPWDSTLGTLTGVKISTNVTGQRDDSTDSVYLRTAFFTGWAPDDFQYYREFTIAPGDASFAFDYSITITSPVGLSDWLTYDYLPLANYYFESRTIDAGHSIDATTTLVYTYKSVPDSGSTIALLGSALIVLAAVRRRFAA